MNKSMYVGAFLLVSLLLVSGFAYAEYTEDSSSDNDNSDSDKTESDVEAELIVSGAEVDVDDVAEEASSVDKLGAGRMGRHALAFYGQGYATSSDSGVFVAMVGVHKTFVGSRERNVTTFTHARLAMGNEKYQLKRTSTVAEATLGTSLTFEVMQKNATVGTVTFSVTREFDNGFVLRTGKLILDSGVTWDISMGTRVRAVRNDLKEAKEGRNERKNSGKDEASVEVNAETKKEMKVEEGFFRRFFGRMFSRSESNSGSG